MVRRFLTCNVLCFTPAAHHFVVASTAEKCSHQVLLCICYKHPPLFLGLCALEARHACPPRTAIIPASHGLLAHSVIRDTSGRRMMLAISLLSLLCVSPCLAATSTKLTSPSSSSLVVPSSASVVLSSASPAAPSPTTTVSTKNPANLVNLFVGTTNGGHVFPGQYLL